MKKTQLIDALRNIQKRWASFLSIVLIIMLGTGGFLSNISTVNSYTKTGTDYYDKNNFKDFDLISNAGIVEEDLERIKNIEGVYDTEGVIQLSATLLAKDVEYNSLVVSKTDRISVPEVFEGRLPEKIDECAINRDIAIEAGLKIGDKIRLTSIKEFETAPLKKKNFEIVGIITHPDSIRYSNTWLVTLDKSAFNFEAFNNSYTNAFVDVDKKDFTNQFNDTYYEETNEVNERLWDELETLNANSKKRIVKQGEEEIEKKLDELYKLLSEASDEIDENEKEVDSELAKARRQLASAKAQLADAYKQIEEGQQEIANGEAQLNEAKAILAQLDQLFKSLNKDTAIKYLREFIDLINQYQRAIQKGDNPEMNRIKARIDTFLNNEYSSIAVKLIEVFTGQSFKDIVNKIKPGDALDVVKEAAYDTIAEIEKNADLFNNLTVDQLIGYIDQANDLITKLNTAIQTKIPTDVEKARDALIEFLSRREVEIGFKIIKTYTGIDVDNIIDKIKNTTIIEDNIDLIISYVDMIRNDDEFLKLFSEEGLHDYVDMVFEYVDLYKDAIKSGIKENIEAARAKLKEIFSEKGSVIIDKLLERFTGKKLEDLEEYLLDGEVLDQFLMTFNVYMDLLIEDDELLDSFTKEGVLESINSLIDYADDLKYAILDDNQEEIDRAKAAYLAFIHTDSVQRLLLLAENATGYDIRMIAEVISNVDDLIRIIDTAQMMKDFVESQSTILDGLTKEAIVEKLTKFKEYVYNYGRIISGMAPGDIEQVKALLDALITEESFNALIELLEETTDIPIRFIIDTLTNDFFIDYGFYRLRIYIDSLIDNIDFKEQYSPEKIKAYLGEVNHYLEIIKNGIHKGKAGAIERALKQLREFLAKDHINFFVDLSEYYFGISLEAIVKYSHYNNQLPTLLDYLSQVRSALVIYKTLPGQIAEGEAKLAEGRAQLAEAWKEYLNARKLLSQKEKEMLDGEIDARNKISDARRLLLEKEEDALKEIEKIRTEINSKEYNWLIQGRDANQSFVDYKSSILSTYAGSIAYGSLFLIVVAMVCFSTIAMIVEEEKKSVGTTKAFGFFNREIFNKYLVFSVLAGVLGSIAGIIYSITLCNFILADSNKNLLYILGDIVQVPDYRMFIIVSIAMIGVCVLSCLIACSDLLKSPAALLMKGDTVSSRDRKLKNKTKKTSEAGTLYSRLILRNMINEKERVLMSIVIVAASCFTVGIGFAINRGFIGMFERQGSEIYKYDFKVEYGDDIDRAKKDEIVKVFNQYGVRYYDLNSSVSYYEKDHIVSGLNMIVVDEDDRIQDFMAIVDPKTKKAVSIPKDGILVQSKMNESYGVTNGSTLHLYDSTLSTNNAKVVGNFLNYSGRLIVFGKEYYKEVFGKEAKNNTYYVNLNGANKDVVKAELSALSDQFKIEDADHYKIKLKPALNLYDILVYILCGIAIVMSFMILTNLANIYVTRKKNELIVMRINGFSVKETINYLAKEAMVTTVLGLLIAFLMGRFGAFIILMALEPKDGQYVRDFNVGVWILAVIINIVFSFVINAMAFRKVKNLNYREIQ